jgi:hypothetical protein
VLLNADGNRIRRAIGFRREYRLVSETEQVEIELVSCREVDLDQNEFVEKCATPPITE